MGALSIRHILAIALRLTGIKRRFVFPPDYEQPWLLFLHPLLPLRIGVYVGPVIVEKIALDASLARPIQKIELVDPKIGIVALHIWIVSHMARARCFERQEICA